jgi:monoamine oxidase
MTDTIIIGAGAAGLSAARKLLQLGSTVCVLEARDRVGGRIHTMNAQGFSVPIEAGAEFIHGELPLTKALMKEAGVSYRAGEGKSWNVAKGRLSEGEFFDDDWEAFMDTLHTLKEDITIGEFLRNYFNDVRYDSLRENIISFVEGYDAADADKASALSLREEWNCENIKGFRPVGGYSQLMEFLAAEIKRREGVINFSSTVQTVQWKRDQVIVTTTQNEKYIGRNALITIPVSLLKNKSIRFDPQLPVHDSAFGQLEMGGVIKFHVEFHSPVWEQKADAFRKMPDMNFLFSDAFIPTWWTQRPSTVPLLTGWLAGPILKTIPTDRQILLQKAYDSLTYLLGTTTQKLKQEIKGTSIVNWLADPFSLGAYGYKTTNTSAALKVLSIPVDNTLFFAGEAIYDGTEMGTVEAALASGVNVAGEIARK